MSRQRAKGTSAETAIVNYLQTNGWPYAERRALNGARDRGDITGIPGICIEVKNAARCDLAAWVDETQTEGHNAAARIAVTWHKRRGKTNPGDWFVTMPGNTFLQLIRDGYQ